MTDPVTLMTVAGSGLAGLSILSFTALRGWSGWLELQRGLAGGGGAAAAMRSPEEVSPAARIELADLRERVRKLEAIAAGVDL